MKEGYYDLSPSSGEAHFSHYGKHFQEYQKLTDLTKVPDGYAKNRKIVIKNGDRCKFPFKKKMFRKLKI